MILTALVYVGRLIASADKRGPSHHDVRCAAHALRTIGVGRISASVGSMHNDVCLHVNPEGSLFAVLMVLEEA
jgi:hypothetical protein